MSMMKKLIYTMLFTLAGLVGMAQTNQPLPSGAIPFGATTYLSPLDSTIWLYKERDGTAIKVANWVDVDSLFKLGWTPTQIDSAITAQAGAYLPLSGGTMSGNIDMNTMRILRGDYYTVPLNNSGEYNGWGPSLGRHTQIAGLSLANPGISGDAAFIGWSADSAQILFKTRRHRNSGQPVVMSDKFVIKEGNNVGSLGGNDNMVVGEFFGSVTGRMDGTTDPDGYESQFATQDYVDEQDAFNVEDVTQTHYTDKAINVRAFNNTGMDYQEGSIDFGITRDSIHTMGLYAFKQGLETTASGNYSSAFGQSTTASGYSSSAFGLGTTASGYYSSAFGYRTIANEYASLAIGRYSTDGSVETSWNAGSPIFKVGNGTGTGNRSNAYVLYNDGKSTQYGIASYGDDYSVNFTNRSIPDVGWVNNNFVDKSTNQTGIGGDKEWTGSHQWVPPINSPSFVPSSIAIYTASSQTEPAIRGSDATASSAFMLRAYATIAGTQLTLSKGGIDAAGAYTNTSDSTIKNIVTDFDYSAVDSLPARAFMYKDNRDSGRVHVGYIAQEVREVLPDAVYESEETGLLSVDHVQVIIAKLARLEEKVKQLEARIEALEN